MNTKALSLILIATLLLSACSPGVAAKSQAAETPVTPLAQAPPPTNNPVSKNSSSVASDSAASPNAARFTLTSPDVNESGRLPTEYTCDGVSATLPLTWSGAPAGTQSYAVIMHHVANPEDVHWYWVLYNIPADVTGLAKNSAGIGTLGTNSVNGQTAYTPPCSKGPGDKVYTYTVYALSAPPQFSVPASQINRAALLEVIEDITLASAELPVTYARK